ncbi:MAG: MgtC/SapB family protein [Alphaproteobacteria bacterium]|nr:MgtC/SapB family protein [Alphaproteobacteria bacterium]
MPMYADALLPEWISPEIAANFHAVSAIIIALILGLIVGYERSYRGRAAGMRTYGLVCMSACALVVVGSHPEMWFSGQNAEYYKNIDPSRIIQGITTGIGFLGAGVIMRDGLNISGLTTAASIWTVATIGVMVGIGFLPAGVALAAIATIFMMWGGSLELFLPMRHAVSISLLFDRFSALTEVEVFSLLRTQGYGVASGSFSVVHRDAQTEWRFVAVSHGKRKAATLVKLGECFRGVKGIQDFNISHARN